MKYFIYIGLPLLLLFSFGAISYFYARLKYYHFFKLTFNALIKKQKSEPYVSSFYLQEIIKFLVRKREKNALISLSAGRISAAEKILSKHKKFFFIAVLNLMNSPKNFAKLETFVKNQPKNKAAIAELAVLYFNENNLSKVKQCLDNLPINGRKNFPLARSLYLQAFFDAKEGDLLSASVHANQAAAIFHKLRAFFEEAQAYTLLGIIYRTAVIPDVAQMMFDTALKIVRSLHLNSEEAKIFGNLGMLMAIQKRFDEAQDFYDKAISIYMKNKQLIKSAEIYNQSAQLNLMKENFPLAAQNAKKALDIHLQKHNDAGTAFSKEILAYAAWSEKNYAKVVQLTFEAKNLYKSLANYSAYYENLHLMALALFEQNKLDDAEKILREITANKHVFDTNFHTANAFNLLGLIYLKKNDRKRAKGLFQQSLDLEQVNNRLSGIATDYANIGLIEFSAGNKEQAVKTFQTALDYALANQDEELIDIIQSHLNKIQ